MNDRQQNHEYEWNNKQGTAKMKRKQEACRHHFGFTPAWFFSSPQNSEANCLAPFAASPAFSPAYTITAFYSARTTLAPSLMPRTPLTATLAVLRIALELATLSVIQRFSNCPRALPRKDMRGATENGRMESWQKEGVFWSGQKQKWLGVGDAIHHINWKMPTSSTTAHAFEYWNTAFLPLPIVLCIYHA